MSYVPPEVEPQKSWMPTKKFIGAAVVGLITIGGHALASQGWDSTENAELMTLLLSLATAYFVTNDATPGGVPVKKETL